MQAFYTITFVCSQTRNMEHFLCLDYEMELNKHSRSTNSICLSANCEAIVTMTMQHRPHGLPDTSVITLQRSAQPYVVSHISLTHNYTIYLLSFFICYFNTTLRSNRWLVLSMKRGRETETHTRNIFLFFF
jgi:hypothetical protein